MRFCTQCGYHATDDARFCASCGSALDSSPGADGADVTSSISLQGLEVESEAGLLSPGDQAAVDALPAGSALLIVQRGPQSGSRFLLDAAMISAGRHPESEIFLDDVTVSRRHAEFLRIDDETFQVRDAGSLNGTYVNRERIEDETVLSGGDEVQIGKYRLVFFASAGQMGLENTS
ncbi:MAG: FHA domain-containing protein [Sporichthyaceae bacterium]